MMVCKTPAALEMAIKAAAKASPLETGRAVSGFYFHRLLCRVFSKPDSPFMLKGGQSMLARTMDARATRDIDLLSEEADLDAALAELRALAEADLGDFVVFEFVGAVPIKVEDEYRSGLKVAFVPLLGGKRLQEVSIDLVADRVACGEPEIVTPADRIDVAGVPMFDYRVYPLANSLADKLCAMVETHDGKPSSRIKDLVDVAIYATTVDIDGGELCRRVRSEAGARGIVLLTGSRCRMNGSSCTRALSRSWLAVPVFLPSSPTSRRPKHLPQVCSILFWLERLAICIGITRV